MNILGNRKKYYVIFCIKEQNMYVKVRRRKSFNPTKPTISYQKRTFVIDVNKPTYSIKNKVYYFIDMYDDTQITFDASGESMNSDFIDLILHKRIVQDLASRLTTNAYVFNILIFVVGAVIGALVGYIISINTIPTENTNGDVLP